MELIRRWKRRHQTLDELVAKRAKQLCIQGNPQWSRAYWLDAIAKENEKLAQPKPVRIRASEIRDAVQCAAEEAMRADYARQIAPQIGRPWLNERNIKSDVLHLNWDVDLPDFEVDGRPVEWTD